MGQYFPDGLYEEIMQAEMEDMDKKIAEDLYAFYIKLRDSQIPMDPEIAAIIHKDIGELY